MGHAVSIHAPHAGRDSRRDRPPKSGYGFNPRAHCGRDAVFRPAIGPEQVSIHAPHAGHDFIVPVWI